MLAVESLVVHHANTRLLGPVSFEVLAGCALTIMGETGAGKSLLVQAVIGALPQGLHCTGKVWVNGERVDGLSRGRRQKQWGRSITMLPQEPWRALDPLMRSDLQIYETHRLVAGSSSAEAKKSTVKDIRNLSLESAMFKFPGQLSGGMSQRVAFAAAVAGGAPLILADEPNKGLDADRRDAIIRILKSVPQEGGTLIVISHDIAVAESIGGQLLVMKDGSVVEVGAASDLLSRPEKAYTKELIAADPLHWEKLSPTATGNPLLRCENLVVGRNNIALTDAVNFAIKKGGRLAVTGPSGVGKSTLLDTLAGLMQPVSGHIRHELKFTSTDIQKIYQDPPAAFAPHISLRKSLSDVARLHRASWQAVEELLTRLSISAELLDRKPDAVSGGELQRIAIVRALLLKPKLLLADEPTSRLDPITQKLTMVLLAQAAQESGTSVVLVTHDCGIAEKWTDASISLA